MKLKKLKTLSFSITTLAIVAQACHSNQKQNTVDSTLSRYQMTQDSSAGNKTDLTGNPVNQFLQQANINGLVEVEMGKIGQQKAALKSIKDFAEMIEKEHTGTNEQLTALASAKGFKLSAKIPGIKNKHLKDLSETSGKDFDSYFINMMVEDHLDDIALFEGAAKSPDQAISSFAVKILPVLQKHYKMAREISMQFDQNKNKK